jgi:hypothetical protein
MSTNPQNKTPRFTHLAYNNSAPRKKACATNASTKEQILRLLANTKQSTPFPPRLKPRLTLPLPPTLRAHRQQIPITHSTAHQKQKRATAVDVAIPTGPVQRAYIGCATARLGASHIRYEPAVLVFRCSLTRWETRALPYWTADQPVRRRNMGDVCTVDGALTSALLASVATIGIARAVVSKKDGARARLKEFPG